LSSTPPPTGGGFKICNLLDEHTREALACHVARLIDAEATVKVLDADATGRGCPQFVRCHNRAGADRSRDPRLMP
jgi:putative transposase